MKRSHRVTVVVAIALLALLGWFGWRLMRSSPAASPAAPQPALVAPVTTAKIERTMLTRRITTYGEIAAGMTLGVSFARAGQIARMVTLNASVRKGAVLATLTPDPATLQGYRQAVTAVDVSRKEWRRQQELLKLQLATQSQVDAAEKSYRDAAGNLQALDQAGGGSSRSVFTAPFDGVVSSVSGAVGDRIAANAPVLQFARTDVLKVLVGIDPVERRFVRMGTAVTVLPFLGTTMNVPPIAARVGELQDAVDPKSMLVTAVVYLRGVDARTLVPGMKVRATLDVESQQAMAVPRSAVLVDEQGSYVFQVADGKARRVPVKEGFRSDDLVAIIGNVDAALPVVVAGNYELDDGMAVRMAAP